MWSLMVLSLPCATSAHHPPGSLEAVACSQVLKPRVGPAGVYTLPALMSLTGSNINMSRFGQASRFSFFSFLFFSSPHSSCHFHSPQGENMLSTETRSEGKGCCAVPGDQGREAGEPGCWGDPAPFSWPEREASCPILLIKVCPGRAGVFLPGFEEIGKTVPPAALGQCCDQAATGHPPLYLMLHPVHGRLWKRGESHKAAGKGLAVVVLPHHPHPERDCGHLGWGGWMHIMLHYPGYLMQRRLQSDTAVFKLCKCKFSP